MGSRGFQVHSNKIQCFSLTNPYFCHFLVMRALKSVLFPSIIHYQLSPTESQCCTTNVENLMKQVIKTAAIAVLFTVSVIAITSLTSTPVHASCVCKCVNGEVTALCTSTLDIEPICRPIICPIALPSIAPIQMPRVPPIGTSRCAQRQVYNGITGRYEWREVCY